MRIFVKILLLSFCLIQSVYAGSELVFSALTLDQATKNIIEKNKTKVLAANTEIINGKKIHVIKILTSDGRVQYLKVDAETGKLVK